MSEKTVSVVWCIDGPKITDYLLNPVHPRGGSKAKYLLGFGFTQDDPQTLADALSQHKLRNFPGKALPQPRGPNRVVLEGTVAAPDGRAMPLRTVWEARDGFEMRFITAVPLTR